MILIIAFCSDAVVELRENGFDTSSGSESEADGNEVASNGSGDTEGMTTLHHFPLKHSFYGMTNYGPLFFTESGPEEECHSSSDDLSSRNESNWPYSYLDAPPMIGSNSEFDRKHARDFTKSLAANLIPKLLKLRSGVEVDESIQEFASNICQENSLNYSDFDYNLTAINADGIYLATYSALLLSFELMKSGHYENPEVKINLTESYITSPKFVF